MKSKEGAKSSSAVVKAAAIITFIICFIFSQLAIVLLLIALKRVCRIKITRRDLIKRAVALRAFLVESGPAFIKLGQFISTRPNTIDAIIYKELRKLQFSIDEVGSDIGKVLSDKHKDLIINPKPVSVGSVAQVFFAQDSHGNKLALKILRPGVRAEFEDNFVLMESIIFLAGLIFKNLKAMRLPEALQVIKSSSDVELDMLLEAATMDKMRDLYIKHGSYVSVPKVYWQLTSPDVLAMEWIDGYAVHEIDQNIGLRNKIIYRIAESFLMQFHDEGVFHADLHPGNIKITKDGRVFLLDFGITGELSNVDRYAISNIMHAFVNEDYQKVADIHFAAGYVPQEQSKEMFALFCRSIAKPMINKNADDISIPELLSQLFIVIEKFDMSLQPQLILLQKTMISLEAIIYSLNPQANMWSIARNWFDSWQRKKRSVFATFNVIKDEMQNLLFSAYCRKQLPFLGDSDPFHSNKIEKKARCIGLSWKCCCKIIFIIVVLVGTFVVVLLNSIQLV